MRRDYVQACARIPAENEKAELREYNSLNKNFL
jgi:hypothetical protein